MGVLTSLGTSRTIYPIVFEVKLGGRSDIGSVEDEGGGERDKG